MSINLKIAGVLLCLILPFLNLYGQHTTNLIVYDYQTNEYENLSSSKFNQSIKRNSTEHFCGEKTISELEQSVPTNNLIDDTNFTNLIPISNLENKLTFPYTTSVKIILPNMGDKHQASGVMVGDRYVLTTAHSTNRKYTNEILFDKIDVIASYDKSINPDEELRSTVAKIYFVEDWEIWGGEDLVILELEDPIGLQSGWMSIGYESEVENLSEGVYHKMSYPAYNTPYNDKPFTGNDLHISYGVVDYISEGFIGVQDHLMGLGGESGSPIFKTNNKDEFITYGVLSFLGNYSHTTLKPSIYYAFEDIIGQASTSHNIKEPIFEVNVFPNPTSDFVNIEALKKIEESVMLEIYNSHGQIIANQVFESKNKISLQNFEKGIYHILLKSSVGKESFSFVVQ